MGDQALEVLFAISDILPLSAPENQKEKYFKLEPSHDIWRCLKGLWVYEMQLLEMKQLEESDDITFEPTSVVLAEARHLKTKFDDVLVFVNNLPLKNPRLAELRDYVKIAYLQRFPSGTYTGGV